MTMTCVGIIAALHKKGIEEALKKVTLLLESWGVEVVVPPECASILTGHGSQVRSHDFAGADLLLALGGDGCVLQAARVGAQKKVPILGVRVGGFGFLSEVDVERVEDALRRFLEGRYSIDTRPLLQVETRDTRHSAPDTTWSALAVNDVVVSKSLSSRLPTFRVEVSGQYVATYPADGIVVATPTGSTAYSMSAGGPIVGPEVKALIITPLAPHALSVRPLVVSDTDIIMISIETDQRIAPQVMVIVDGQPARALSTDEVVTLSMSEQLASLVRLGEGGFFERLRKKLMWGERV